MQITKSILENIRNDAPVVEVLRGVYWTAVQSRYCGLASSMVNISCPGHEESDGHIGSFTRMSVKELAEYCYSNNPSNASLGMAAVNSLLRPDLSKCADINGITYIQNIAENKYVTMIGHFPGTDKIQEKAKKFYIIEKRPQENDYPEESTKDIVPVSDILIISSTTLLNHTLENILALCKKDCVKILLGPSTPMTEVLFDYGIDILSGSIVSKPALVQTFIKEGANFRQIKQSGGIRFVTMMK